MNNTDRIFNKDYVKCHFPFFWLCGNETERDIVLALERVKASGADGVTVESREFPDFQATWWRFAEVILKKCRELGLKVVFVDEDSVCPCGHAFALVNRPEYKHLRRASFVETHVDVAGPLTADFVVGKPNCWSVTELPEKVIGCFLYKRTDDANGLDFDTALDITDNIRDGILSCSVPEGNYRIMYVYYSYRPAEIAGDDFVDFLNPESVDLLISSVYETYEKLFSEYFGNTLVGFFSDEPFIGNAYVYCGNTGRGAHEDTRVGHTGITMPANALVIERLKAVYGDEYVKFIPSLWYEGSVSSEFRNVYMNIVSELYSESFSQRVGSWCAERGLVYMGHVLEDNNLHTRIGDGPGHYFRSQKGQNMPGADIVLHQIMPGFADTGLGGYGAYIYDNEFYHYVLGKLAPSAAHTYPDFDGRAMCELTIGYGWAEGSRLVKWLFDYLLVRGTNYFVPGAVRPIFPDFVHAPHFGDNDGREPQFKGYCKLIDYSRKVVTAFDKTRHVCNALILYHAQAEWMSGKDYTLLQAPAKALYDNHIDYDILSDDLLKDVRVENGKMQLKESYDCLVVPYAKLLPKNVLSSLSRLKNLGADVVFTDALPENCDEKFAVAPLFGIADYFKEKGYTDVSIAGAHLLRHYHAVSEDGCDVYMFFNESVTETFDGVIGTGRKGNYNVYDFLSGVCYKGDGDVKIRLEPYQSAVVVYEKDRGFKDYAFYNSLRSEKIETEFTVKCYPFTNMEQSTKEFRATELEPISKIMPDFSGKIEYEFSVTVKDKPAAAFIKFGSVGENAELFVNGVSCGLAVCNPYVFDVSRAVKQGENAVKAVVYTTLANSQKDPVSMFVPLAPTGISGDAELLTKN